MGLKVAEVAVINYTKDDGDVSKRIIVPSYIPYPHVKAADVTDLDKDQVDEMVELMAEYQEYYRRAVEQLFNFETWVEHTQNKTINPKWRTFKTSGISEVKE